MLEVMIKYAVLALGVASLSSCGLVPLPAIDVPDQSYTLPAPLGASSSVVYVQALSAPVPNVPVSSIKLSGTSQVRSDTPFPNLSVNVYASAAKPNCPEVGGFVVCDQPVGALSGTVVLSTAAQPLNLGGNATFDQAVKSGQLWLGLTSNPQAPTGGPVPGGATIEFTQLKVSSRL